MARSQASVSTRGKRDPAKMEQIIEYKSQIKLLKNSRDSSRTLLAQATRDLDRRLGVARAKAHEAALQELRPGRATNQDFQRLVTSLMESIAEKEEVIAHQRNDSQLLGAQVQRLEKRLKTLQEQNQ